LLMVTMAGLSCEAELFLGPDETTKAATSGKIPFVSTGELQPVTLPIVIPAAGVYNPFIDVFVDGNRVAGFFGSEQVASIEVIFGGITW